jgi:hypothetical protein
MVFTHFNVDMNTATALGRVFGRLTDTLIANVLALARQVFKRIGFLKILKIQLMVNAPMS